MKSKKKMFVFVIVAVLVALAIIISKNSTNKQALDSSAEQIYDVVIKTVSATNYMFSQYDIDIYVDGEKLGTIENGEWDEFPLKLAKGEHELKVVNSEDENISNTEIFKVKKNVNYQFRLESYSNEIRIYKEHYEYEQTTSTVAVESTEKMPEKTITYNVHNKIEESDYTAKTEKLEIIGSKGSNKIKIRFTMNFKNIDTRDVYIAPPYRVEYLTVSDKKFIPDSQTPVSKKDGELFVLSENESKKVNIELEGTLSDNYDITSFKEDDKIDLAVCIGSGSNDFVSFVQFNILCNMTEDKFDTEPVEEDEPEVSGISDEAFAAEDAFETYCKSQYPYGIKLHWLEGALVRANDDGTYSIKVNATITNMYNAKYNTVVEGKVDKNGNVIYFLEYN